MLSRQDGPGNLLWVQLGHPGGEPLPPWQAGAHVELLRGDLVRPYSLTGDPQRRDRYELAIFREPGRVSASTLLLDELQPGSTVRVRGPKHRFDLEPAQEYLFIGGGSGVAPLLPMAHEASRRGAPWRLVYGARTAEAMALFRQRLDALVRQDAHGRVEYHPHDTDGLLPLAELLAEPRAGLAVYCCGPEALLDAVEDSTGHWPDGSLHLERHAPRRSVPKSSG